MSCKNCGKKLKEHSPRDLHCPREDWMKALPFKLRDRLIYEPEANKYHKRKKSSNKN